MSANVDVEGMYQGASLLTRPAEEYVNNESVEALWVQQACQHADIYYSLITTVPPELLRLTAIDDRISDAYLRRFSSFINPAKLSVEDLKSDKNKTIWREFCELFKDLEDYSFGTLLRLDANSDYSEENTILVTRIQFLAIEIARNRFGLNNHVWRLAGTQRKQQKTGEETEEEMKAREEADSIMDKVSKTIQKTLNL